MQLDPIQQRVVGVLLEKERTVPDTYPMTENSLISGCNQKSNRDPQMEVDETELHPALLTLREDGWIVRVEGGGRSTKYRHRIEERLSVNADEQAVLCELLIRGAQAPGALKPRVHRLGFVAEPHRIEAVLEGLAAKPTPLAKRLPKRPRERDCRWIHLLGPRDDAMGDGSDAGDEVMAPTAPRPAPSFATTSVPVSRSAPVLSGHDPDADLLDELVERVRTLESEVAELKQRLDMLM